MEPTIFADVTNDMRIAQEKAFGPILSIIGFQDEAEAISIANDINFGLAEAVDYIENDPFFKMGIFSSYSIRRWQKFILDHKRVPA